MLEHRYQVQGSKQKLMEVQLHGCNNSNLGPVGRFELNEAPSHLFGKFRCSCVYPAIYPSAIAYIFTVRSLVVSINRK